ncbi:MAG: cytochrome C oxidase subunit II [Myxococcota bacterium]
MNSLVRLASGLSLLLWAGVAHAAPKPETAWGLPHDASVNGHLIDWLINSTSVFVGLLFAIMVIWMLWACIKHGADHPAEYDHGDGKHHITVALSISAAIFFVVDGNLFYNAMVDVRGQFWNFDKPESHPQAVRIEVNAHQWAWDARYAGPDGRFNTADDIVTLNDLRVPVGTPVLVQLASTDVIHSLYLPNFRIKQDAMPGMINRMWFQAKETGEFDIACAQHCGVAHYKMKGQLTVLPRSDYDAWVGRASAISSVAFDAKDDKAHWGWAWKPN